MLIAGVCATGVVQADLGEAVFGVGGNVAERAISGPRLGAHVDFRGGGAVPLLLLDVNPATYCSAVRFGALYPTLMELWIGIACAAAEPPHPCWSAPAAPEVPLAEPDRDV